MVDGARYRLAPHSSPGIVKANSLQPKRNLADRGTLKIHRHPEVAEFLCLPLLASLVITDIVSSFAADAARHSRTRPPARARARPAKELNWALEIQNYRYGRGGHMGRERSDNGGGAPAANSESALSLSLSPMQSSRLIGLSSLSFPSALCLRSIFFSGPKGEQLERDVCVCVW